MSEQELERDQDTYQQAERDRDSTILKVASGFLIVSMAFYRNFVGEGTPQYISYLTWAWICFVSSLIAQVVAYYTCLMAFKMKIENQNRSQEAGELWFKFNWILNLIAPITLIIGIVLMLFFACNNLPKEWYQ
ncbi:MAG: hypothetical protein OXH56_07765 [Gemmatimonadetes bacterium]|nr:hypothetical protein [Gemmatimonadota bacterium]